MLRSPGALGRNLPGSFSPGWGMGELHVFSHTTLELETRNLKTRKLSISEIIMGSLPDMGKANTGSGRDEDEMRGPRIRTCTCTTSTEDAPHSPYLVPALH